MTEKVDKIVEAIYANYASGTGVLFGIPSEKKECVRAVVVAVLRILEDTEEKHV